MTSPESRLRRDIVQIATLFPISSAPTTNEEAKADKWIQAMAAGMFEPGLPGRFPGVLHGAYEHIYKSIAKSEEVRMAFLALCCADSTPAYRHLMGKCAGKMCW